MDCTLAAAAKRPERAPLYLRQDDVSNPFSSSKRLTDRDG
jgi:hypothetical protein